MVEIVSAAWQEKERASQARLDHAAQILRRATPHVTTTLRQGEDPSQEILEAAQTFNASLMSWATGAEVVSNAFCSASVADRVLQSAGRARDLGGERQRIRFGSISV